METIITCIGIFVLVWVTITDIQYRIIPNKIIFPAIGLLFIIRLFYHPFGVVFYLLWGLIPAVLMFCAAWLTKGKAFGMGDVKLMIFVGLCVGVFGSMMTIVFSGILMVLFFLFMKICFGKSQTIMPMAPFIFLGFIIFLLVR